MANRRVPGLMGLDSLKAAGGAARRLASYAEHADENDFIDELPDSDCESELYSEEHDSEEDLSQDMFGNSSESSDNDNKRSKRRKRK